MELNEALDIENRLVIGRLKLALKPAEVQDFANMLQAQMKRAVTLHKSTTK
jgi:hypothetical protein